MLRVFSINLRMVVCKVQVCETLTNYELEIICLAILECLRPNDFFFKIVQLHLFQLSLTVNQSRPGIVLVSVNGWE